MEANQFNRTDKKGRGVVTIAAKDATVSFIEMESGLHEIVFGNGDKLVPTSDGGWKVVGVKNEILLPKNGKWKLVFADGSKVFQVPFKNITSGELVFIHGSGFLKGGASVYVGGKLFRPTKPGEYKTDIFAELERRAAIKKWSAEFSRDARRTDNDDDEENVMRALKNGNGDLLGF